MRCFHIFVHGKLDWAPREMAGPAERPPGFYCNRYVLARTEPEAREKAFRRVRNRIDRQGWLRDGLVELALEVEESAVAPIHWLLKREEGLIFYDEA